MRERGSLPTVYTRTRILYYLPPALSVSIIRSTTDQIRTQNQSPRIVSQSCSFIYSGVRGYICTMWEAYSSDLSDAILSMPRSADAGCLDRRRGRESALRTVCTRRRRMHQTMRLAQRRLRGNAPRDAFLPWARGRPRSAGIDPRPVDLSCDTLHKGAEDSVCIPAARRRHYSSVCRATCEAKRRIIREELDMLNLSLQQNRSVEPQRRRLKARRIHQGAWAPLQHGAD